MGFASQGRVARNTSTHRSDQPPRRETLGHLAGDNARNRAKALVAGLCKPEAHKRLGAVDVVRMPRGAFTCQATIATGIAKGARYSIWNVHVPFPGPTPVTLCPPQAAHCYAPPGEEVCIRFYVDLEPMADIDRVYTTNRRQMLVKPWPYG